MPAERAKAMAYGHRMVVEVIKVIEVVQTTSQR
jgi:hypothetical protein